MLSSPTGWCAVQWSMWKGLNSSENYLLLGFLLAMSSQTLLLLFIQSVTKDIFSSSVFYLSSSKVKWWKNSVTLETEIPLFKRVELCQETIQSRNEVFPFFLNYGDHPRNVNKPTNTIYSSSQQQYPYSVSCYQHLAGWTPLRKFFPSKSHRALSLNPLLGRPAGGMINSFHSF